MWLAQTKPATSLTTSDTVIEIDDAWYEEQQPAKLYLKEVDS